MLPKLVCPITTGQQANQTSMTKLYQKFPPPSSQRQTDDILRFLIWSNDFILQSKT